MNKKIVSIITLLIFVISVTLLPAMAAATVTIDAPSRVDNKEKLTISGKAPSNEVVVRVISPSTQVLVFDTVEVTSGSYSVTYTVPDVSSWARGSYTIMVSANGEEVSKSLTIGPASSGGSGGSYTNVTASPSPSASPTASPEPSASPSESPSASPTVTPGSGNVMIDGLPFTDIPADVAAWVADSLKGLYEIGAINGKTATEFDPNGNVTRAEFTKILVSALQLKSDEPRLFADVPVDSWYAGYVGIAASLGVTKGVEEDLFAPDMFITREQMCTMIYRAAQVVGLELPSTEGIDFTDTDSISDWARNAVDALQASGIVNGTGDGYFTPQGTASRAATAKVIYGIFSRLTVDKEN